ncbi:MAG TPA: hypothetical protein VNK91_11820 [Burkholderiaceae bacterium]|jgi:hypothetical protein|nr:hypothetical protein [Burkholderiaceae bacterium]
MRVEEVPQEGNATLGGRCKAVYAVDADGRITLVPSRGWEAEELVTSAAVEHFEALAAAALQRVRRGESGALEYFMYARRFDVPTLAKTAGIWSWRLQRHLRQPFAKLPARWQARYAQALGLPLALLRDFDPRA